MTAEEKRKLLAKLLQEQERLGNAASSKRFPLSPAQQRLWFIDQLQPGLSVYIIPATLRLEGALDIPLLQRCLNEIVVRHEILRTRFVSEEGMAWQVIEPSYELPALEEAHGKGLDIFYGEPFDLSTGPLLRARVTRQSECAAILHLAIHHIIADYWSLRVLMRELQHLYASRQAGKSPNLPALSIQYVDYAVWQDQQQDKLQAELDYWKKELAEAPSVLQLPTDYARPGQASYRGARLPIHFSYRSSQALSALARQERTTLFSAMLAVLQAVLFRYSGQEDFCIGSTVTNRDREETRDLIGLFVNNLVFRSRPNASLTFRRLIEQAHDTVVNGLRHQQVPFERIVDALQIERQLSHNPLFQVMFLLRTEAGSARPQNESVLCIEPVEHEHITSRFDLSLELAETSDGLTGFIEYSTDLYRPSFIARLAEHLERVLECVTQDPDIAIGEIDLLTEAERKQFVAWNQTACAIDGACAHELIEQRAVESPDVVAVALDDRCLTYAQLNARANQLARYLKSQGCQAEDTIAIHLSRSELLVVSLLAIMKLGAHYLPLDPTHPAERLREILQDAQAVTVLTDYGEDPFGSDGISNMDLSAAVEAIARNSEESLNVSVSPDYIAYLIYTSGSTGCPKGVPIQHRSLVNLLVSMADKPGVTASDTLLAVTTIAFDIATLELLLPLTVGACVYLANEEATADGVALGSILAESQATIMQATPATWRLLLESGWSEAGSLKIWCGGEAMDAALAKQLLACGKLVWNLYGPTETTIWSGALEITKAHLENGDVPIGGPIANTGFHVLDPLRHEVPMGVAGELHLSGLGLSPGYHQRDRLTEEKFFNLNHTRVYATGDRVRFRENGVLEFLGRLDHQIKLRGFRIELGEIETQLTSHPSIKAAIVALHDGGGEPRLIAWCLSNDLGLSKQALRGHLAAHLPSYMIPSECLLVDDFPLTPNGKVDRKKLPAPGAISENLPRVPITTPTEKILAKIWQELLDQVVDDRTTHFFDVGGHSLLVARMMARVRAEFEIDLQLRAVFDEPTLGGLAAVIDAANATSQTRIETRPPEAPRVLTHAQQRQLVLAQLDPDNPAYNIPAVVKVCGDLEPDAWQRALTKLCERHDVLHTAYHSDDGGTTAPVLQAVCPPACNDLDYSTLPASERLERAEAALLLDAKIPIKLTEAPLLRVTRIKLSADEHLVMLVLHHIIGDAWSLKVLLHDLLALSVSQEPLAPLPLAYSDYAHHERHRDHTVSLTYWKEQLRGAPVALDLPMDFPRPVKPTHRAGEVRFVVNRAKKSALERLGREQDATLFMTVLAAFKALLFRYSGNNDLVIGSPVGHRPHGDLERIVGLFVNTLSLRTQVLGEQSFPDLLKRVRCTILEALEHQDVPFDQVVSSLETERDWDRSPIFQVMFLWQNETPLPASGSDSIEIEPHPLPISTTKFDLTLAMATDGDELRGRFEFRCDLFDDKTIQVLAETFKTLIESIVSAPDTPIQEHRLIQEQPEARLQTQVPLDSQCLHELIEAQTIATPQSVAVVHGTSSLSYHDINEQADCLAVHLQALGVGAERPVGICLARDSNMIIAILAVLKAGGAYVPIDPAYPKSRIQFILEDADAEVVITNEAHVGYVPSGKTMVDISQVEATATKPRSTASVSNAAYIIYTSGSTGVPKGVTIEHRSTVAFVRWAQQVFSSGELQGVLASTSICFDLSVFEIFVPLCSGGTIILSEDALELGTLPKRDAVTLINTVPSAAAELVRNHAIPESVITVNVAGEPLGKQLVRELYSTLRSEKGKVYNLYGPSEDTTYSTYCEADPLERGVSTPIGRAVRDTKAYVLDARLNQVPAGMVGDLYLAGTGLARGYWKRPALSAEVFIPNPFTRDGAPLYHTGDRARVRSDGYLEFLGRADGQIKLRGFRIELGEIEQALQTHPEIEQAAVALHDVGTKVLVAYLASKRRPDQPQTLAASSELAQAYRNFLTDKVPSYMIPSSFVELPQIPRLPNGKLNRAALHMPDLEGVSVASSVPTNATEETLATIWKELLGQRVIGIHDNFFALGGDSIIALQVIAQAQRECIRFSPRDLFQNATIAGIAAVAEIGISPASEAMDIPIDIEVPAALTPIQRWFFELPLRHRHHWNQALLLEVREALDIPALTEALDHLRRHHHALRATFEETGEGWSQAYQALSGEPPLLVIQEESDDAARTIEEVATEAQGRFDLSEGPLWQVVYFDLATAENTRCRRLLVVCHHLLIDGVSWRILLADLQLAYQQFLRHQHITLLPPTTSVSVWMDHLQSYDMKAEEAYWSATESEANLLKIPVDNTAGSNLMASAKTLQVELDESNTRRLLTQVPQQYSIRIDELLIAALAEVITRWSGHAAMAIQLEYHGRAETDGHLDLSRTVGWLTALFPVIIRGNSSGSVDDLLKDTKEVLRAIPNEGVGYGLSREHSTLPYQKSKLQIRFNYLGQADQLFGAKALFGRAEESSGIARHGEDPRDVVFELNALVSGGKLKVYWIYASELHQEQTIQKLATDYERSILHLLDHCLNPESGSGYTESEFPLMDFAPGELDDLLQELD